MLNSLNVFLQLMLSLFFIDSANADPFYQVVAETQSFENWSPAIVIDDIHRNDGIYSAFSEIDQLNKATASVSLANGTIKIFAQSNSTLDSYPSKTVAYGKWDDRIYFDFTGVVTLEFTYDGYMVPSKYSSMPNITTEPYFLLPGHGGFINVDQVYNLTNGLFHAYGVATFSVLQNQEYYIGNRFSAVAGSGSSFNGLNTSSFKISMPTGGAFTSASGVLLTENTDPVPEPATMILFGAGLAGLAAAGRRRKKEA